MIAQDQSILRDAGSVIPFQGARTALGNAGQTRAGEKARNTSESARVAFALLALGCLANCGQSDNATASQLAATCSEADATALYTRKIEPILRDDRPTSCNQCHLSGIDLSLFVRDTPCQTMACMNDLGLVDLQRPEASTVLGWISRAKPQSALITADVIQQEYDGFLEWIRYSASCGQQLCAPFDNPCGRDQAPAATRCSEMTSLGAPFTDPGDCQELTLEQLFSNDVYQWRARCSPCHFSSDTMVSAPKWISDSSDGLAPPERACQTGSLQTMRNVLQTGLVNLTQPAQSLLLLKPLSLEGGGVSHGGGAKFEGMADPSYQTFLAWINRYAACSAQDPTLPKAAPPPPVAAPAAAPPPTAAPMASIYDYCNCVLLSCHDASHAKWGETDEALLAACRTEALSLPQTGASADSGNSLECRAASCEHAKTDPDMCSAALGDTICR